MKAIQALLIPVAIFAILLSACEKDEELNETTGTTHTATDTLPTNPPVQAPFQELYDQGIDRYLGEYTPSSTQVNGSTTQHFFSGLDAPICYTGNSFSMFTRNGSSNNLMIFLQGCGFCGPSACDAVEIGLPFVSFGILNPNDAFNPVADWNVGYVPYCDGSGMMGDREVDIDGDGVNDRFFRGAKNLSASLDVIAKTYPSPNRIVLAGNSAGGFAVHAALALVHKLYPKTPIDVINDSGLGIMNPGGMEELIEYWGAASFFPKSCSNCIGADGNTTDYHKYQLEQDTIIRLAYVGSKQDETFAQMIGAANYESQVLEAASEMNTAFPDRFNCIIANGNQHTFLIREFEYSIAGTNVKNWVSEMVSVDDSWVSIIE